MDYSMDLLLSGLLYDGCIFSCIMGLNYCIIVLNGL